MVFFSEHSGLRCFSSMTSIWAWQRNLSNGVKLVNMFTCNLWVRSDVAGHCVFLQAPQLPIVSETQPGSSATLGLLQALGKGACPFWSDTNSSSVTNYYSHVLRLFFFTTGLFIYLTAASQWNGTFICSAVLNLKSPVLSCLLKHQSLIIAL